MKMLIVGASGQIGYHLKETLKSDHVVTGTYFSCAQKDLKKLDMTEREQVDSLVGTLIPDIILLPAAMPHVDACQVNPDLCYKVNARGVFNVLDAAARVGAKIVYFSTDYIFDGLAGPYSETDQPNPISVYGQVKYEVEKRIRELQNPFLIIRTTGVYSWEKQGKNFVMGLIRRLQQGEMAKVPRDQIGTPTYAPNLARVVKDLVELDQEGVFHVAGPDLMDRYEFALQIAEAFNLDKNLIRPVLTEELGQKAPRPLAGGLKIDKVKAQVNTQLMGVREALAEMKAIRSDF